jgi:TPR repeat protein
MLPLSSQFIKDVRSATVCEGSGDTWDMRGRQQVFSVVLAVAMLVVLAVAASAVLRGSHFGWPAWVGVALSAVIAMVAAFGRKMLDIVFERPLTALKRSMDRDMVLSGIPGYRQKVEDSTDRAMLKIHPAIPLPADAPADLSDEFPRYVRREVDAEIRPWIRGRASDSCLIVLVGPAAAGKTRLLSEALQAELPDWQMLRPSGPQINALVDSGADLSRSVLWLNELQTFFAGEPLSAAAVEALLAGRHGPVVLAGTIRGEERDRLLGKTASGEAKKMNRNASEILRMLARWSGRAEGSERAVWFDVQGQFNGAERARASELASSDPRLGIALRDARDGDITATLACESLLIDRWRGHGDRNGQALVTAAVIARRCGHPEPIPEGLLDAVALAHLSGQGEAPESSWWLPSALKWAQAPIIDAGDVSAIRPVRTMPGQVDGYRVSDILLQHSQDHDYPDVELLLGDEAIWRLALDHASPSAVAEIALSAYNAEMLSIAQEAWHIAADRGDARAARRLGLLYWEQDQDVAAEMWLRRAVALSSVGAMNSLASWLFEHDQDAEAELLLRHAAADLGDPRAMVSLGLHLGGSGELQEAERWTRKAAELGNAVAMANLVSQLIGRGAYAEAEQWGLKAAELGSPGAMANLGELYHARGNIDAALTFYRRGAEQGYADVMANPRSFRPWPGESGDQGVSEAILLLANLLNQSGQSAEAQHWYRRGAEVGDARAAAALAAVFDEYGDPTEAAAWRQQAATLARANLARNKATLLAAYGESGVLRHTSIMVAYADDLARRGDEVTAKMWYRQAASFGDATAEQRLS